MKVTAPHILARLLHDRLTEAGDPARAVTLSRLFGIHLSYAVVRESLGLAGKGEYDVAVLGLLVDRALLQVDPAVEAAARRELESSEPGLAFADALSDRLVRLRRARGTDDETPGLAELLARAGGSAESSAEPGEEGAVDVRDAEVQDTVEAPFESPEAAEPVAEAAAAAPDAPDGALEADEPPAESEPPAVEPDELSSPSLRAGADPGGPSPLSEPPGAEPDEPFSPSVPPAAEPEEPQARSEAPPVEHSERVPEPGAPSTTDEAHTLESDAGPRACRSCDGVMPAGEGLRFCPHCGSDQEVARCTSCGERLESGWAFCPRCGRGIGA